MRGLLLERATIEKTPYIAATASSSVSGSRTTNSWSRGDLLKNNQPCSKILIRTFFSPIVLITLSEKKFSHLKKNNKTSQSNNK
ncbi:hypothetical protein NSS64_30415 [Paenibacillus sp. FSL H8-0122]|uniref:hypothetical protein n=1 Tax=Paenibacillus sp. FSL H8-0122 TaxID=2954510 RepID=UPI0030F8A982